MGFNAGRLGWLSEPGGSERHGSCSTVLITIVVASLPDVFRHDRLIRGSWVHQKVRIDRCYLGPSLF